MPRTPRLKKGEFVGVAFGVARRGKGESDIPLLGEIRGGLMDREQLEVLQRSIEETAAGIIRFRTQMGYGLANIGGGGGIVRLPAYSRAELRIPGVRTSAEERSPQARAKYQSMVSMARAKMNSLGSVSMLSEGRFQVKRKGVPQRGARREWIKVKEGYAQLRSAAGLHQWGQGNMSFTGKMLQDIRAKATVITHFEGDEKLSLRDLIDEFETGMVRYANSMGGRGENYGEGEGIVHQFGESRAMPLYTITVALGFATKRSADIAYWQQSGIYGPQYRGRRRGHVPRVFMGFGLEEERQLESYVQTALSTAEYTQAAFHSLGGAEARNTGGQFIAMRY